jgi:type VI secretion system protein ImpJ
VLVEGSAGAGRTTFFAGTINDTRVFGRGDWYLGIRSTAAPAQVAARAPELVKACAARFVARLVREALPGLGIEHIPLPPAELPARPGTVYFRVLRTEPCWGAIVRTSEIGVYVPAAIPDADLTLEVVLAG